MKKLVTVSFAACAVAVVGSVSAEELGDRGTVALSGSGFVQAAKSQDSSSFSFAAFTPRIAWFFADGIALSIGPRYSHSRYGSDSSQEQTTDRIGGELRIGGLLDLSDHVSLWPQVGVFVDSVKSNLSGVGYLSGTGASMTAYPYSLDSDAVAYGVSAEIPVVLKLSKHTFASLSFVTASYEKTKPSGGGPSSHSATLGINPGVGFGIGGWF